MSIKKKLYRIEEYEGEIDTNRENLHECLGIDERDAMRISSYVHSEIMSSEPVNTSEILLDLLKKYYGAELVFAVYLLGWQLGQMIHFGILIPRSKNGVQEGYL